MPNPPTNGPKPSIHKEIAGVETKWWLIGGGASIAVVWYVYHRQKAAQPASDVQSTDPNATDGSGYDFAGGSYSADNSGISAAPVSAVAAPATFSAAGDPLVPHTTAAWIAEAEAALLSMGYTPDAVSSALSAFATGAPLTADQAATVASAGGATTAPPIIMPHPSTTAVLPPSTSSRITVPPVLTGIKVPGANRVKCAWTPSPNASGYHFWRDGSQRATFSKTTLTFTTELLAKGKHTFWVQAFNNAGGHIGSNQITVTV